MRGIETAAAALVRKIDAIGGQALSARADVADPVAGARLSRTTRANWRLGRGSISPSALEHFCGR
jgi:hypothetical protein